MPFTFGDAASAVAPSPSMISPDHPMGRVPSGYEEVQRMPHYELMWVPVSLNPHRSFDYPHPSPGHGYPPFGPPRGNHPSVLAEMGYIPYNHSMVHSTQTMLAAQLSYPPPYPHPQSLGYPGMGQESYYGHGLGYNHSMCVADRISWTSTNMEAGVGRGPSDFVTRAATQTQAVSWQNERGMIPPACPVPHGYGETLQRRNASNEQEVNFRNRYEYEERGQLGHSNSHRPLNPANMADQSGSHRSYGSRGYPPDHEYQRRRAAVDRNHTLNSSGSNQSQQSIMLNVEDYESQHEGIANRGRHQGLKHFSTPSQSQSDSSSPGNNENQRTVNNDEYKNNVCSSTNSMIPRRKSIVEFSKNQRTVASGEFGRASRSDRQESGRHDNHREENFDNSSFINGHSSERRYVGQAYQPSNETIQPPSVEVGKVLCNADNGSAATNGISEFDTNIDVVGISDTNCNSSSEDEDDGISNEEDGTEQETMEVEGEPLVPDAEIDSPDFPEMTPEQKEKLRLYMLKPAEYAKVEEKIYKMRFGHIGTEVIRTKDGEWKTAVGGKSKKPDLTTTTRSGRRVRVRLSVAKDSSASGSSVEEVKKGSRKGKGKVKGQYECEVCQKVYCYFSQLKIHKQRHKIKSCSQCDLTFIDRQEFINHQHDKHGGASRRKGSKSELNCNICNERFVTTAAFYTHRAVHDAVGKYPCALCGLKFWHWQSRRAHFKHCYDKVHTFQNEVDETVQESIVP